MGHSVATTVVYVGVARLPQPLVTLAPALAVELEMDVARREIVSVATNLPFLCLGRLLREVLVGRKLDDLAGSALLEMEVRYAAPFASAVRAAIQSAARRALEDALSVNDGAPERHLQTLAGNGHKEMPTQGLPALRELTAES